MKHTFRLKVALGSLLVGVAQAAARTEWKLGEGSVALFATGSATYDSNLGSSANGSDDVYFTLTPLARYRKINSLFKSDASVSVSMQRYASENQFNNDSVNASYSGGIARSDERTFGASVTLGFNQSVDADSDLNRRVASDAINAGVGVELMVARDHLFRANTNYRMTNRDFGSDQIAWGLGTSYAYSLNEGTDIGASYNYSVTETESVATPSISSLDQTTHAVALNASRPLYAGVRGQASVGYRWLDRSAQENAANLSDTAGITTSLSLLGQFLPKRYFPKTTGTFRLAYESAASPGLNDDDSARLIGSVGVDWRARDTTSFGVSVSRSQDLSASDQTVVNNTFNVNVSQRIARVLSANVSAGYSQADFVESSRSDDRYTFSTSLSYQINRAWSASLAYTYLTSESSLTAATFDRHTATLAATYAF